jgi:hypothetical protein
MRVLTFTLIIYSFLLSSIASAQITTPVIRANFGVDADLRSNFFNGFPQAGNDDWFWNGNTGAGTFVIDTTGAAKIISRYATDVNFRKLPFYRTMHHPPFSVVNNRLLIDAVFIRDYHGDDSTIFASGANKNGMSPASWSCPVSQSIPDKNDILDMMVHVRRAGPNATDSLWMMGGVSIENTTGNRYFDFEMYQTDIYYDRPSRQFYNYGPQAGHTAWQFNASGGITRPGDIIFTAEYGSSSLSLIEARIWVDRAALTITPTAFNWTGSFDGATSGSQYGYAGITPKTAGIFYTGLQSGNNEWAGPFQLIREDNSVATTYQARQFMEFSVNLTKLGLDPVTLLGGDACGMPFRRVLVKSRASTSFTAELKDFVGPFDFFLAPRAQAAADIPLICGTEGISIITITNPSPTSVYTWSTTNGHIIGSTTGTSIIADTAGTYIVRQQLQSGCSTYALDTVVVTQDMNCTVLKNSPMSFSGVVSGTSASLKWQTAKDAQVAYFDVEMSANGHDFAKVGTVDGQSVQGRTTDYGFTHDIQNVPSRYIYFRLMVRGVNGEVEYSNTIRLTISDFKGTKFIISPNPAITDFQISINSVTTQKGQLRIIDNLGRIMQSEKVQLQKGNNAVSVTGVSKWSTGIYQVQLIMEDQIVNQKLLVTR